MVVETQHAASLRVGYKGEGQIDIGEESVISSEARNPCGATRESSSLERALSLCIECLPLYVMLNEVKHLVL